MHWFCELISKKVYVKSGFTNFLSICADSTRKAQRKLFRSFYGGIPAKKRRSLQYVREISRNMNERKGQSLTHFALVSNVHKLVERAFYLQMITVAEDLLWSVLCHCDWCVDIEAKLIELSWDDRFTFDLIWFGLQPNLNIGFPWKPNENDSKEHYITTLAHNLHDAF